MAIKLTKRIFAALLAMILTAAVFALFPTQSADASTFDYFDFLNQDEPLPEPKKGGVPGRAVVIADYDNCLTASEESELIRELESAANKAKCNIGIVIAKDSNGMSYSKYANKFSDDQFGYGTNSVVLLLFNSYNKPEYSAFKDWISTDGKMRSKIDNRTKKIFDRIYKKMGEPKGNKYAYNESTKTYGGYNYEAACREFAACVKRYGAGGAAAVGLMFTDYMTHNFLYFAGGLGLAAMISLFIVRRQVKKYKVKAPISAVRYMDRGATRVTNSVDRFIREYTTSHTHSSSGGGHGGHGGGGHGGGGGHHR